MRNDVMYHLLIFGTTVALTQIMFGSWLGVYQSTNTHRQLEPHYQAEKEYKKKMEELEALEGDDDDEDDEDDEDDD